VAEGKALAYGHSYTGNALGCAAAKASLEVFAREHVLERLGPKIQQMQRELKRLQAIPAVAEVRQCGFIAGIELKNGNSPAASSNLAAQVCLAARQHGLLTRPIRSVIVLMPPFCIEPAQLTSAVDAIERSLHEVCEAHPA
jgi:adenosylmethionine-8-amino-7-oxononanoate aminotransferase